MPMVRGVISDLAQHAARRFGDAVALTLPGMRSFTFRELDDLAGRFATGLRRLGIECGDRIVLHLPNGWEWIVAYHAIARIGAVVVPANFLLSPKEVEFTVADSGAIALILPAERRDTVAVDKTCSLVTLGETTGELSFDDLLDNPYCDPVARSAEDVFTIGYTSGTTGKPKGAVLTHGCVFASLAATATLHVRNAGDTVLSSLPFPHVYGNIVMNAVFLTGTRLVATPRFDPGIALKLICDEQVTLFEGVPTMYYQMLADPGIETADLRSLIRCTVGGQTMPASKIEAVVERFGCPLLELWGMTEVAGPAITHSPYWPPRHGSIGLPAPGTEVRIASFEDPQRAAAGGEAGELMLRGPSVMRGYWNNAAATAEVLGPQGWLATGDIVRADADGYLFVVDRRKDLIITAGYNVYPAELEQVIAMHKAVVMVAVTGVADAEKGELAQAFVVRSPNVSLDEAELLAHCRKYLAAYKVPRLITFVDDLPKTSTGKILRRRLREAASVFSTTKCERASMSIDFFSGYTMSIDGKAMTSPTTFAAVNPATEEIIATVPDATRDHLDAAVAAAQRAFVHWSARPLSERQALVAQIGDAIEAHAEDFMRLLTKEQGKARKGAEWEILGSAIWCREIAKQELPLHICEKTATRTVETRRVPLGVVGAITPWNFPVLLAVWKIAPALVAGNTMVLKPSPYTPLCTLKLGELIGDILPPGVLNVISGGNELGGWISTHPDIRKISFTGSTATGRKIMAAASGNIKRITLELGGNDPAIVLPDVNIKETAEKLFWAAFQNSAQFCVAAKRLYIHAAIYDELAAELVAYAKTVRVGDGSLQGTDLGPIQNKMQFDKLKILLDEAKASGHRFLLGGDIGDGPGFFVPITIIDNPPEDSRVVVEEAFGPILPLLKFDDVDDVISRANNTEYGLAASVWGKDIGAARRVAERIEAGTVWVNEIHTFSPHVAFGGHKQSGIGIENALDGLAEYTNAQTLVVNEAGI
jgi:acyl-CoA reductase-like NAD-dependent aldehyde dehydrogenase/acyl-CoA synthetase (AMP-forming)/AMP-acid ligase II